MLSGLILAGGNNCRMHGKNKALLPFAGQLMIEWQRKRMSELCDELIIVTVDRGANQWVAQWLETTEDDQTPNIPLRIALDVKKGFGPLSGLHAGLEQMRGEQAWVVACDMPMLCPQVAAYMVSRLQQELCEAVVPWVDGYHQMLHAVYSKRCLPKLEKLLTDEMKTLRLQDLLYVINWIRLDEHELTQHGLSTTFAKDMDTPKQYAQLLLEYKNENGIDKEGE